MTLAHRLLVILGRLAVLAVILVGAEIGVRSGVLSQLFFSSPSEVFKALLTQWSNGSFLQDAASRCSKRCSAWSRVRYSAWRWACPAAAAARVEGL